ncbi:GNAT family N-acetyltransferase [Palleronia sp. KMU-117]|uniref:GNAT family N-acetyltransferase n=1 Tax=Palleronia sp. KMU-117 TaxID=3434108 RepID=UPI003D73096E
MGEAAQDGAGWSTQSHSSILEIPASDWNACVGHDDPLLRHQMLDALERSGVASAENGFTPCHVVLKDAGGRIVAAAPAYLKTNSKGELGADIGHAIAHRRVVGEYFPKLQVEVPMVPFSGQRLLVRGGVDRRVAIRRLAEALQATAEERGASSVQISYLRDGSDEVDALAACGFAMGQSNTYTWQAGDETSFDQFLGRMITKRRTEIKRHRRRLADEGVSFRHYRGAEIPADMSATFFPLYVDNFLRHRSETWLNQSFFDHVFRTMSERIDVSVSTVGGELAGAVFSVAGPSRGYSLYWGQRAAMRFLYFDQVIYRAIERAFVTGLECLDFGATGEHKAHYGLAPSPTHHAFWYRSPAFRDVAIAACHGRTRTAEAERMAETARLPFVRSGERQ